MGYGVKLFRFLDVRNVLFLVLLIRLPADANKNFKALNAPNMDFPASCLCILLYSMAHGMETVSEHLLTRHDFTLVGPPSHVWKPSQAIIKSWWNLPCQNLADKGWFEECPVFHSADGAIAEGGCNYGASETKPASSINLSGTFVCCGSQIRFPNSSPGWSSALSCSWGLSLCAQETVILWSASGRM